MDIDQEPIGHISAATTIVLSWPSTPIESFILHTKQAD